MKSLSLALIGLAYGFTAAWVFRRTANLPGLRQASRLLQAHFLELWIFWDDPVLIWRAQRALLTDNLRLLVLTFRPALVLALPSAWLFLQLDSIYGLEPLRVGEPAVVTVQLQGSLNRQIELKAPPQIAIETPPVRVFAEGQISWRIRPLKPVLGILRFTVEDRTLAKIIAAGCEPVFLIRRRVSSLAGFLLRPEEGRLPAGDVAWIEVLYPAGHYGGWRGSGFYSSRAHWSSRTGLS